MEKKIIQVVDLSPEHEQLYFQCLEDWSLEIKEAGNHKEQWYAKMKQKGLRVKLALDDKGIVGGMIQYCPAEHSYIEGKDLYFIYCIWVHGYKKGRGDYRKKGMGKALLAQAEEDVRNLGAKGMAAWGVNLPVFMRASWFMRHGYKKADQDGMAVLVYKSFTDDVEPPRWIKEKKKPELIEGKVTITAFHNGWCPAQNMVYERAKRAASKFGESVVFQDIDTFERNVFLEWGITDALFIDGKEVMTGPPPSFKKIKKLIAQKVKKLKRKEKKKPKDENQETTSPTDQEISETQGNTSDLSGPGY
jgi:N-acetylglutamate synthase-like GNAT family acetyltransferase